MEYLHTMLRITSIEDSLNFFCDQLGMVEVSRKEHQQGRFTLIFLASQSDYLIAKDKKSPLLELTYNWPSEGVEQEALTAGRSFGHIAYRVENIYQTCQNLMDAGVIINRPPRDGYMAFVKSPDGISIELLQKGESLPPKEPWQSMQNQGNW